MDLAEPSTTGAPTNEADNVSRRPTVAQRLIDATIEVIDSDGEAAVRVLSIVETVGVPIPVLYRQFGNRDGLVQAAQSERLTRDLELELSQITAAVEAVETDVEFRALIDTVVRALMTPHRAAIRFRRINVIGSAYGRPDLAATIATTLDQSVAEIATVLRRPQALGWLREGLDVEAFAAWFAGQMLGRVVVELGTTRVETAAFDDIQLEAFRLMLFG